jgi:hypothetical protein
MQGYGQARYMVILQKLVMPDYKKVLKNMRWHYHTHLGVSLKRFPLVNSGFFEQQNKQEE